MVRLIYNEILYSFHSFSKKKKLNNFQLSEKLRELEKQAVRAQIDLDTLSLNKIEMIRDFHRKKAMKELEEWRLNVENPMFDGIEGIKQENRKAYK